MEEARTISETMTSLNQKGFSDNFRAEEGRLRAISANRLLDPEQVIVEKFYRFEGETDLDEEAILFALRCPKTNIKGTYLVAFGPKMDEEDAKITRRLAQKIKSD